MALEAVNDGIIYALVAAWNNKQEASVTSQFHADVTQNNTTTDFKNPSASNLQVTAPNATDQATSLVLTKQLILVAVKHFEDLAGAHNTVASPTSGLKALGSVVDLASAIIAVNLVRTVYEAHRTLANCHFNNDVTNTITAPAASDQTTLNTLLNELKADLNAHILSAPVGQKILVG